MKNHIDINSIMVRKGPEILLHHASWKIEPNQHWALIGPNGSGKSTLIKSLWGGVDICRGSITLQFGDEQTKHPASFKDKIGYVAFELHQDLLEQEDLKDQMREYCGKEDETTTAKDLILSALSPENKSKAGNLEKITAELGIAHLLAHSIHALSTGEMRKVLIARALIKSPALLILDEPFDGLDKNSKKSLLDSVSGLMNNNSVQVILIVHRLEEIPSEITHIMMMKAGATFLQGKKHDMLTAENLSNLYDCKLGVNRIGDSYSWSFDLHSHTPPDPQKLAIALSSQSSILPSSNPHSDLDNNPNDNDTINVDEKSTTQQELLKFENVTVKYGEEVALDNLNLTINSGENWAILGPNGSGKSTIVKLITGDNLQGYSNQVFLFGHKKGSSKSIWEIRNRLGYVSGELQSNYRKNITTFEAICSGFHDSVGLYRQPTQEESSITNAWIDILDLHDLLDYNFNTLSYGQKRMILLARAMVKTPELLIIDEPCHGLDIKNRIRILDIIQRISETSTNILYVTHHQEEIMPCISHILEIDSGKTINKGPRISK